MTHDEFGKGFSAEVTRRQMLRLVGLTGAAALAAACAPSAPAPSAPAGTAPGAAPAAGPAKEAWEVEWDTLVAAAKAEGNVSIQTPLGAGFRNWVDAFQQTFQGISVEHTALRGSDLAAKAKPEREAGIFNFDVVVSSPGSIGRILRPIGYFDPLRDVIFRPDVTGDQYWIDGYDSHFLDLEKRWFFGYGADLYPTLFINTSQVKEDEIKSYKDLLNPKWKGKILQKDPRTEGAGYISMSVLRVNVGAEADDFMRRFYAEMEPGFGTDDRQNTEFLVRGRYAISLGGINQNILADFQKQGAGTDVKLHKLPEFTAIDPGDCLWNVNRAPHPNAAKLFINWSLTKEGQQIWTKETQANSGRTDVPPTHPDLLAPKGTKYNFQAEENDKNKTDTRDFIRTLLPR